MCVCDPVRFVSVFGVCVCVCARACVPSKHMNACVLCSLHLCVCVALAEVCKIKRTRVPCVRV